ncbi:putative toxin-antitoxin system toxin component, PIN family [Planktothrix agardhii]|uniref:putative toxin-antitoxin system toxin component, PIN family n=1 Tax=Planktothrix agardhii TaxID=1160 RepID=UPI00287414F2|nr:putative toxin-antitoxin system toxin component, PIN family [Planktothrix agardhii]MDS1345396.1 putative toxin-antitoxin system toxin component, PIN family [Planktothrix agardhii NRERC-751]
MMKDKLFIFDANIIISAVLLPESKPDLAIRKAQNSGNILMSPEIWAELEQVLARPKFDRYISSEDRSKFLQDFFDTVILVMDVTEKIQECRDPKDNKYLELAVNGQADYLITGDADLLVLNPFREKPIITVSDFLNLKLV